MGESYTLPPQTLISPLPLSILLSQTLCACVLTTKPPATVLPNYWQPNLITLSCSSSFSPSVPLFPLFYTFRSWMLFLLSNRQQLMWPGESLCISPSGFCHLTPLSHLPLPSLSLSVHCLWMWMLLQRCCVTVPFSWRCIFCFSLVFSY